MLVNPLVYASEGLRGTLVPQFPHLSVVSVLIMLTAFDVLLLSLGLRQFRNLESGERFKDLSQEQLALLDRQVNVLFTEARERTATVLRENRAMLEMLRDLLIEKKTIDAKTLGEMNTQKKTDKT